MWAPGFPEENFASAASQDVGYSAVILYIVHRSCLRDLLLSLSYLHSNVKTRPWPILLMYADDLNDPTLRKELELRAYETIGPSEEAKEFVRRIEWIKLDWHLPASENISHEEEASPTSPVFQNAWPGK
jgi:hypothetical protein